MWRMQLKLVCQLSIPREISTLPLSDPAYANIIQSLRFLPLLLYTLDPTTLRTSRTTSTYATFDKKSSSYTKFHKRRNDWKGIYIIGAFLRPTAAGFEVPKFLNWKLYNFLNFLFLNKFFLQYLLKDFLVWWITSLCKKVQNFSWL